MSDDPIAFPILSDAEIDVLRAYGEEATFHGGEALWLAGDVGFCFFCNFVGWYNHPQYGG